MAKNIKLLKVIKDEKRGRVYFEVLVDGKKKSWNVAKGLFSLLKETLFT